MTLKKQKATSSKPFLEDGPTKGRLTVANKGRNKLDTRTLLASLEEPEEDSFDDLLLFEDDLVEEDSFT